MVAIIDRDIELCRSAVGGNLIETLLKLFKKKRYRSARYQMKDEVHCTRIGYDDDIVSEHKAVTENISLTGMKLITPSMLPVNSKLHLTVKHPVNGVVTLSGVVARSGKRPDKNGHQGYDTGIKFLNNTRSSRRMISSIISSH